ncbi:hypothetical protein FOXB_16103, partial [Fusarium oxysporum f. sp. conglutinans Fo5176]
ASEDKAKQLIGSNLANITLCPVAQEPAGNLPDTEYAVRRRVFPKGLTQKIMHLCKAHGVTVTALLTALQAFALLQAFPPQDPSRSSAAPICVSNRLRHTTLACNQDGTYGSSPKPLHQVANEAAAIGPVMATTFLVTPFEVGPFLEFEDTYKNSAWSDRVWEVAKNIHQVTKDAIESNISEHVEWTQGPNAFGAVTLAMEAMKVGHIPAPPGMLTPLSSAGLLDGVHIRENYGHETQEGVRTVSLRDFAFFSRVSNLFGQRRSPSRSVHGHSIVQLKLAGSSPPNVIYLVK